VASCCAAVQLVIHTYSPSALHLVCSGCLSCLAIFKHFFEFETD